MYVPEMNQKMFCFTNNYSTRRFKDKGKMSTIQNMLMNATHGGTTLTAYKFRSMYIYPNWVHFCFKPLQFNTYTQLLEQLLFINILTPYL